MNNYYHSATLSNGLTVLLKEIHSAPIISQWIWYRIGSRNEVKNKTGISHWVEHMQFKGTPKYPAGFLDKAISRCGGLWNAFTYMDWTAYYTTVPAAAIDLAIDMESDRMKNSLFLPEEVESERTVILSEMEGGENDPLFKLDQKINKAAFKAHPYRNEVIGEREDIESMSRDDLYSHYQAYYSPNNAVLALAGDFESDEMLKKIDAAYGSIPQHEVPVCNASAEGKIEGDIRVENFGPCDVTTLKIVWRAPSGNSADIYPLTLFDSLFSGPSSLNMFGGGSISNRSSRLFKALVESGIASAFNGGFLTTIDPYIYTLIMYLNPGRTPEEALEAVDKVIKGIVDRIDQKDLSRALKQARALFAYSSENITNQAYWLGYSSMFSDPAWLDRFIPSLTNIDVDTISHFTSSWLSKDHRVVGINYPDQSGKGSDL